MVQSASYGAQLFESAMMQHETPPSDVAPSPKEQEPEEIPEPPESPVVAAPKRQVNNF